MVAIDTLKKDTEIIFISGLNLHKTPEPVQEAFASKKARGPTPIICVFDGKVENLLEVVPYFHMKDVNGFTDVLESLAEYRGTESPTTSLTRHEPETWTDRRGRRLEAAYVRSSGKSVTLRLSNGKLSTMSVDRLSEDSRERITELAKSQ